MVEKPLQQDKVSKITQRLVQVGLRHFVNPVIALKAELNAIVQDSSKADNPLGHDLCQVPIDQHATLIKMYVQQWGKQADLKRLKPLDQNEQRLNLILTKMMQADLITLPVGWRSSLILFDKFARHGLDLTDREATAYDYLFNYYTVDFALQWLLQLGQWGEAACSKS